VLIQPFETALSKIGGQIFLRCDPKYRHFWDNKHGEVLINHENIALRAILAVSSKNVIKKGELDEEYLLLGIDTSEPRDGQLRYLPTTMCIGSDKLLLRDADLIITKLGAIRGYVFDNTLKGHNIIGSTELIPYELLNRSYYPAFLKYLLLLPVYLLAYAHLESGKTPSHWRVNPLDLLRIRIPKVTEESQSTILKRVTPLQQRINKLKDSLTSPLAGINRVFAREFQYDPQEHERWAKQNSYQKAFKAIDSSFLLRSSVKFHHPKYDYLGGILSNYSCVKLKTLSISPICRGVQPEYEKDGETYVIKTDNLQNGIIDLSEAQMVSRDFYEAKKATAGIERNDILIASTGVGSIGKVDLYELDEEAIADGHISIVRPDTLVNPHYLTYYLRSILGYFQIERELSGSTNQIEIYPEQLEQIRVIDLPRKKQDEIVEEIRSELHEIQKQKAEIARLRDNIDATLIEGIIQEAK
jgi:restriction endonuclease S subunit